MPVSPIIKAQLDAMGPADRAAFLKAYPLDGYEPPAEATPETEAPAQAAEPDPTTPTATFQAGAEERLRWFFFGFFFVAFMGIANRLGG
jgi:hypothetical protein